MGQGGVHNNEQREKYVARSWRFEVVVGIMDDMPTTCEGLRVAGRAAATPAVRDTKSLPVNCTADFSALVKQG